MFAATRNGRRRREEAAQAREAACVAAGCQCYCHVPVKDWTLGQSIFFAVKLFLFLAAFWALVAWLEQPSGNPPEPYYCADITSTGAPANCHPAILPPDVLKKYEDHFKH